MNQKKIQRELSLRRCSQTNQLGPTTVFKWNFLKATIEKKFKTWRNLTRLNQWLRTSDQPLTKPQDQNAQKLIKPWLSDKKNQRNNNTALNGKLHKEYNSYSEDLWINKPGTGKNKLKANWKLCTLVKHKMAKVKWNKITWA